MTLAQKIVSLREKTNMTQKELAQKIGVSTGIIAEWESEESIPTLTDISKLSEVFSVSTDVLIKETEALDDADTVPEGDKGKKSKKNEKTSKKPLFMQIWFWIVISVALAAVVLATILLLNDEVKPKIDEEGNPIFVELTDEVYTNADEYLGYYVNVKGKVFQNLGDNGETKGVHVWIDPDNCEQNLMIHYTTDESLKDGDYIICTGYIKEIYSYTNAYGTELTVPLIYSTDLRSATYIEVMSPTVETISLDNLIYQHFGCSIAINKVEFAENETRLYLTAINNSNATMYVDTDASVIIQNGKQYNSKINYMADYEVIPYSLRKGTTASGVVVFSAVGNGEFEYTIEIHSDDVDGKYDSVTFKISKEASSVVVPTAIGTYCRSGYILDIYSDGTLYLNYGGQYTDLSGIWSQSGNTICYSVWSVDGFVWNNPFYDTVYDGGINFLGDYYSRVG